MIAAIAGFFMWTSPRYDALKLRINDYQQITEANSKAAALRVVRQQLTDARKSIPEKSVDKLTAMLPDSVENVGLIIDIDNIATKYGMRIRDTKVSDAEAKSAGSAVGPNAKKYGTISLSFGVTTSYENFQAFLQELENNVRLVDVTNLTFSAGQADTYDFTLTIQTYWLK